MYLTVDFFEEFSDSINYFEGHDLINAMSLEKGYELINHAYELLKYESELYRADIISNLRKAINCRIKDLFKIIGIDKIKFSSLLIKQKIEKLESLGLVKSLLLSKLLLLRNTIEYDGENAPSLIECHEFIDIVWYFYKTTDIYCKEIPDSLYIEYYIEKIKYSYTLKFDFVNHSFIKFYGALPNSYFHEKPVSNNSMLIESFQHEHKIYKYSDPAASPDKYEGLIKVDNINYYREILAYILSIWD